MPQGSAVASQAGWPRPSGSARSSRAALIYLAIGAVQRGASFLVLPLYAAVLSPAEYGQISVIISVSAVAALALSCGLETAVYRAAFERDGEAGRSQLRTTGSLLFAISLVGAALIAAVALVLPSGLPVRRGDLAIALLATGVLTAATIAPLALLRARERLRSYAWFALVMVVTQQALRLYFVFGRRDGVRGWVTADLLSALVVLAAGAVWQRELMSLRPSRSHATSALRLGLPLVPHQAAHWGLGISDRLILAAYLTPAAVGVYGMGYQVGLVAAMAVTELNRAFMPRYAEAAFSRDRHAELAGHARRQVLAVVAVAGGAALLGPPVIHHAFPETYAGAAEFVPWVALGVLFLGLYYIPMNLISLVVADTRGVWRLTAVSAAVNIALNVATVPRFGAVAAAVNTALGYLCLVVLVGRLASRRAPDVDLQLRNVVTPVLLAAAIAAVLAPLAVRPSPAGLGAAMAGAAAIVAVCAWAARTTAH